MKNMLQFELRRLLRKPIFYICIGVCSIFTMFTIFSKKSTLDAMTNGWWGVSDVYEEQLAERFSPQMLALDTNLILWVIVFAVFTSIMICEDTVRGTIKNIYARGYSRTSVFFAKFIVSTVTTMIFYLLIVCSSYLSGVLILATSSHNVQPVTVKGFWLLILGKLLAILAMNALYIMLAEWGGNTGGSIAANIFLPLVIMGIIGAVLEIIMLIQVRNGGEYDYETFSKIQEYWIYPLTVGGFSKGMETGDYIGHLIACGIYFVAFGGLAWLIAAKKQVKN